MKKFILSRRDFLRTTGVVATSIILPRQVIACLGRIKKPIELGMIADLHQDIIHDGPARLKAFLDAMKEEKPDALVQLGDFAYPTKKNEAVTTEKTMYMTLCFSFQELKKIYIFR